MTRKLVLVASIGALLAGSSTPAEAFRKVKFGPFEVQPSFSFEVKHHSNVYVTADNVNEQSAQDEAAGGEPNPIAGLAGLIIDVRPGLNLTFNPSLEKRIRGFYLDVRYAPSLSLFPSAPLLLSSAGSETPQFKRFDQFKLDQNLRLGMRYQTSGRLSFSGGTDWSEPELSQVDLDLRDLVFHGGVKYDFTRNMSIEGTARFNTFRTPDPRAGDNTPLGTFDDLTTIGNFRWQIQRFTDVGLTYQRSDRSFEGIAAGLNDFNNDGIPDGSKDFVQQDFSAFLSRRISRAMTATVRGGKTLREFGTRQFGAADDDRLTGAVTVETTLSTRTRVQASAELVLTDTVRRITFSDLNAFTGDQIGQFSVLPEQFSEAYSRRILVDVVQNVFRRGDQLLFGVAYQWDDLLDQLGTQNFFNIGNTTEVEKRVLDESLCGVPAGPSLDPGTGLQQGAQFCKTILNDQEQRLFLVTAGYRLRLRKWLGLQARGSWFKGESTPRDKTGVRDETPIDTNYWNVSAGLVVNLSVFQ